MTGKGSNHFNSLTANSSRWSVTIFVSGFLSWSTFSIWLRETDRGITDNFVTAVTTLLHFRGLTGSLLCNGRMKTGCSAFCDCSYSRNLMWMTFGQSLIWLSCMYEGPRLTARTSHSQFVPKCDFQASLIIFKVGPLSNVTRVKGPMRCYFWHLPWTFADSLCTVKVPSDPLGLALPLFVPTRLFPWRSL